MPKETNETNIVKWIDWRPEFESEGRYWIFGYFRNKRVVVMKAAGLQVVPAEKKNIKLRFSQLGAIGIYLKNQ